MSAKIPPCALQLLSPFSSCRSSTQLAIMEFEAYEGVHTQDFAIAQSSRPHSDSTSGAIAFAEYAELITEARNLRSASQTMLRSLLEGRDSDTEHSLAREIISTVVIITKLNFGLHFKSRGRHITELMLQQEHVRLGTPTTYALAASAFGRPGSTLPSDFTLDLLKRLHRFASGRQTGTIRYRDEILTVKSDTSDDLDVCRIMSCPNTEDELQACLVLWKYSKPLQHIVNSCVGDYRWLTEWFRNVLPLPEIVSTVARGMDRQLFTELPYSPSWRLRYLVPIANRFAHATQGLTQTDTTSDARAEDLLTGGTGTTW